MKYLFFDLESIHNKYEMPFSFGYVLTDADFNILKQDNLVFNPELLREEWSWRVIRTVVTINPYELSKCNKNFLSYYSKIKTLMSDENVLCVGFAINNDIKYLLSPCLRYDQDCINFNYIDLQQIILKITKKSTGLHKAYMQFCGDLPNGAHNSKDDALMTMKILKAFLKEHKISLPELLKNNPDLIGKVENFCFGYGEDLINIRAQKEQPKLQERKIKKGQEDWLLKGSKNNVIFLRFLENVQQNQQHNNILKDKKISISLNFELYNFKNMIKLVQSIADSGGKYVKKATEADIFVKGYDTYDDEGNLRCCTKLQYVKEANKNGANIEILEFDKFLNILNLDLENLNAMPEIVVTYLEDQKYAK